MCLIDMMYQKPVLCSTYLQVQGYYLQLVNKLKIVTWTSQVILFCIRSHCLAWLVNLSFIALYSLFPYFWCSTVDSIQFHMTCCTAVSCRWRYITDISLVHLLPWSCPKRLPANTCTICVLRAGVFFFHQQQYTVHQISTTWWTVYFSVEYLYPFYFLHP